MADAVRVATNWRMTSPRPHRGAYRPPDISADTKYPPAGGRATVLKNATGFGFGFRTMASQVDRLLLFCGAGVAGLAVGICV